MLFSSITFLYYFLPVTFLIYYLVPEKRKNLILFLASFAFYLWGEPVYGILLLASVGIGYVGGRWMEAAGRQKRGTYKKVVFALLVAIILGILAFFKYRDFFAESFNRFSGSSFRLLHLTLPVGISFYSFQIISYYVDLYRGEVTAEHSLIDFAAYVTMFPQLIAGPIVRFRSVQRELKSRTVTMVQISEGAGRFVCGLCKKVLIADSLGELVAFLETCTSVSASGGQGVQGLGTGGYWVLALAYMMQLYYDFSGYSDMAIGLGKMLGFTFPENFRHPFVSKSISEFWRRWHITLGSWFRDYLYIPLGGNRVKVSRWCINMLIVWSLSGLWHGAGWNFMLWGTYFGIFLILEKLAGRAGVCIPGKETGNFIKNTAAHAYVLLVVLLSFVIFRTESLPQFLTELKGLLGRSETVMMPVVSYEIRSYAVLLATACVGSTPVITECFRRILCTKAGSRIGWLVKSILMLSGLFLATAFLLGESSHPFLYFRF